MNVDREGLEIAQFYVANVGRTDSPREVSGYQIYRCSNMEMLEGHEAKVVTALSRSGVESGESKYVYCRLPGECYVIASVQLDPGIDELGRTGMSFAHGLILTEAAFRQYGCNPFKVMPPGRWHQAHEAVVRGERPEFRMQFPRVAEPKQERIRPVSKDLEKLFQFAMRADKMVADRTPVCLIGKDSDRCDHLEVLFESLPIELRKLCTFDTSIPDSESLEFWCVGLRSDRQGLSDSPTFDINSMEWSKAEIDLSEVERRAMKIATSATFASDEAEKHFICELRGIDLDSKSLVLSRYFDQLATSSPDIAAQVTHELFMFLGSGELFSVPQLKAEIARLHTNGFTDSLGVKLLDYFEQVLITEYSTLMEPVVSGYSGETMADRAQSLVSAKLFALILIGQGLTEESVAALRMLLHQDFEFVVSIMLRRGKVSITPSLTSSVNSLDVSYRITFGNNQSNDVKILKCLLGLNESENKRLLGIGWKSADVTEILDTDLVKKILFTALSIDSGETYV
jgi:hypothetical protein